ncbi:SMI1/KNR4 family protein [Streptomyces sp. JUS-F4]|uniref:SMI1/KNR4 family protein n=1 Tax=Streptomyces TaxID=1883 RepID=UPI0025703CD1|nr:MULTISPECIES: SMI1/KNR4 family protein [Streptomyces]WKN17585.1 SMI1/KNR4 family protein [Streptomyces sp. JUS-F4]
MTRLLRAVRARLAADPVRRPAGPPPLTEAETAEAEAQLGVTFPPEYRRHLLEVSAGGEAFARLERTEGVWWWTDNTATRRDLLALPFPHPDSYDEADDALLLREPRAEDCPDDEEAFSRAWTAWDDEAGEFEDRKTAGAVVLKEHGCGFATLLALTGPLAGTVWWDGRATCDLIVPLSLDHAGGARPVTFGEWLGRDSWDLLPPDSWPRRRD